MDSERLFLVYFWPLYPADARADLERARRTDANPAANPEIVAHLEDAAARFVANAPALFDADLELDGSDASVHRLSAALTPARRDAWAARGTPGTPENLLFNAVVHGAAYVGSCVVRGHGATWSARRPLWESFVRLRSAAGESELAVFHWWLKSLASEPSAGAGATLADRYRAHVEVPCAATESLPIVVAGPPRALPRLKGPTYDRLHKYVRAHLPEVRDLGADFPSPERFAAFELRWIDFHVVGGGRAVLLAGASGAGLHLFWIGANGFDKSAFIPAEPFPEPIVRIDGDRIVVMTSQRGEPEVREMLWWGP